MLSIWRKNRTLLSSLCLILLISGCGLKGPLYQTQKEASQTAAKDTVKELSKDLNNANKDTDKSTVSTTSQETK